jgi:hypothetical protein
MLSITIFFVAHLTHNLENLAIEFAFCFYPGGDVVVLYASLYDDVRMVVNLSGRFYLEKGIEERLGKEFIDMINKEGYIDVKDKSGNECL